MIPVADKTMQAGLAREKKCLGRWSGNGENCLFCEMQALLDKIQNGLYCLRGQIMVEYLQIFQRKWRNAVGSDSEVSEGKGPVAG